jgi:putative transcriptional regulator
MIKTKLRVILAERNMTRVELAKKAGISINTLRPLYIDTWQRIDRNTLNSICRVLEIQPGDLFEYIPEEKKETKQRR